MDLSGDVRQRRVALGGGPRRGHGAIQNLASALVPAAASPAGGRRIVRGNRRGIPDRHPGGPMGTSDRLAQGVRARPRGQRRGTRSMRIPWPHNLRERAAWGAVALAGGLAIGASWLEQWRPLPPDRLASITIRVTSEADEGPGSLREAILAADRATRRTRIVVDVPTITLAATLPPLVNPHGVVLEAREGRVELNGTHIAGPILDIAAAGTIVSGFRIVGGGAGLVVRAPG